MVAKGFFVGAKVWTKLKITHWFGPKSNMMRKDIAKGTSSFIKGFSGDMVVVEFEKNIETKTYKADIAIKVDNLQLTEPTDEKADGNPKLPKRLKGMEFLIPGPEEGQKEVDPKRIDEIDIITGWEKRMATKHTESRLRYSLSTVGFLLKLTIDKSPTYTEADFTIVKRGSTYEVRYVSA